MNREIAIQGNGNTSEADVMKKLELAVMKKCDITILTSPAEAEFLHKEFENLKFGIIPTFNTESQKISDFEERKNLMFLGGFVHTPNIDSAKHLVNDLWPLIKKKIPGTKLYIMD